MAKFIIVLLVLVFVVVSCAPPPELTSTGTVVNETKAVVVVDGLYANSATGERIGTRIYDSKYGIVCYKTTSDLFCVKVK